MARDVDNAKLIDEALGGTQIFLAILLLQDTTKTSTGCSWWSRTPTRGVTKNYPHLEQTQWDIEADNGGDERLAWFSTWIRDRPTIEDSFYHVLTWRNNGGQSCFLGDANSLLLSADFFSEAVDYIRSRFPILSRFTVYGRTKSAAKKSLDDLKAFLFRRIEQDPFRYRKRKRYGPCSCRKARPRKTISKGAKTRDVGMSPSVYVMPGLGGAKWSQETCNGDRQT